MLNDGLLPHSEKEAEGLSLLQEQHGSFTSITRRDPNETGPLLVHIGDDTYEVDSEGKVTNSG